MIGLASTILAAYLYWETPNRYLSIFLIFVLITGGFQLVPLEHMILPAIGVSKTFDWALLFILLVVLVKPEIFLNVRVWKDLNGLSIFGGTLCLLLLYNLVHVGVEAQVAVRVFRSYLFFLLLLPFVQLNQSDCLKVFRLIVYSTTFASFLYCLQPLLGHGILNGAPTDISNEEGVLLRFYNLPFYVMPVIFTFFVEKSYFKFRFHYVLLGVNVLAILLSQHRNLILSIPFCYLIYLALVDKFHVQRIATYFIICAGIFISVDHYFDNRFSNGLVDLSESYNEATPAIINTTNISDISTSEFRRLHFLERYYYAQKDIETSLLGVGFLTEDAELTKRLSFNIGLLTEEGEITQIDTSDITWSLLIIHFGFVGIWAFLYFYWSYLKTLLRLKREMLCVVGILYVVSLFTSSFFGTDVLSPHAVSLLMLIAGFYYSVEREEYKQETYQELLKA